MLKKRFLSILLCAALLLGGSAALAQDAPQAGWVNSDIAGVAETAEKPRPQDDFHLAVNYEWFQSAEIAAGRSSVSAFTELEQSVRGQVEALLQDESRPGHEAQIARTLYGILKDTARRDELGVEPLRPYVEQVQAVSTMEELSALITADDPLPYGMPLAMLGVMADVMDSSRYAVYVYATRLSLKYADEYAERTPAGERAYAANRELFAAVYQRLGYTQAQAGEAYDAMLALEAKLAEDMWGREAYTWEDYYQRSYNPVTLAQMEALSPAFPMAEVLRSNGIDGDDAIILTETAWLERLNSLYVEENLPGFKAMLLYAAISDTAKYLDMDALTASVRRNAARYGTDGTVDADKLCYDQVNQLLPMQVGRMYMEACFTEQTRQDVLSLIGRVIATYRARLEKAEWLTEQTRAKAIEKLDAIVPRVGGPEVWEDSSALVLSPADTALEAVAAISAYASRRELAKLDQPVDPNLWQMSPQTINAYYEQTDNTINILAGILGGVFYDPDAPDEVNMAGIGVVIGHEITHAFDVTGSQFDPEGNLVNWWTDEDRAAFKRLTDRVSAHMDGIEALPGVFVNGALTVSEVVADLGGMSCLLEIAASMPDFNYELFFTTYAKVWREQIYPEAAEYYLATDSHAPSHLRTNVTVQQFEAFYDAFDVQEGDGMYLAPENRLAVW